MSLKALIFDVDGTLAETERYGHRVAFNRAFAEAGFAWHWDENIYIDLLAIGGGRERIVAFLKHYQKDIDLNDTAKVSALINRLHERKGEHFKALVEEGAIALRPGIKRLLLEAKVAGVQTAVATNCSPISLESICQNLLGASAEHWFDVRVTGNRVKQKKPDPECYRIALQELQLAPQQCVAFEDSFIGLSSAVSNHIPTVVTVAEFTQQEDFSAASLVVSDLGEPEQPANVINGSLGEHAHVNLAMLNALLDTTQT